jgi:excisionase family DNA binding protein
MAGYPLAAAASPRLMSIESAAQALGIGRTLLSRLVKDGRIAAVRLGRRTLIPVQEIDRLIADRALEGGTA